MNYLSAQEIQKNLRKGIDNDTLSRIKDLYLFNQERCPTCHNIGKYSLDGEVYKCDCQMQILLQKHYLAANIGREYHNICLDHFVGQDRETAVGAVEDYVDSFEDNLDFGFGLTFSGPVGTGKTFAMATVLKELVKRGRDVYMVTFADLINIWGQSWNDEEAKRLDRKLRSVEILGVDELRTDARNQGGFLSLGLESIIRHRTSNLFPTLITTNLTKNDEEDIFYKSYSLLSARNQRVQFEGEDIRGTAIRRRERNMKKQGERRPIC